MADFPRIELVMALHRHGRLITPEEFHRDCDAITRAVEAYDQLAERCVMDATKASLEIANLRAQLNPDSNP
jgi:hypothetical protein